MTKEGLEIENQINTVLSGFMKEENKGIAMICRSCFEGCTLKEYDQGHCEECKERK